MKVDTKGLVPTKCSAGWGHSAILTKCGKVLICGRPYDFSILLRLNVLRDFGSSFLARSVSSFSQYFADAKTSGLYPSLIPLQDVLTSSGEVKDVVDIVASAGLTIGLTKAGAVFAFGLNRWGQCGVPIGKFVHVYNLSYLSLPPVNKIDAGLQHAIALTTSGKIYGWGKGSRGQLSDHSSVQDVNAAPVPIPFNDEILDVSLGFTHSAVLTTKGEVFVWGKGMSDIPNPSSLGETYQDQRKPRKLAVPGPVVEICSSSFSLVARTENGALWAMGLGEQDKKAIPNFIPVFAFDSEEQLVLEKGSYMRKGHNRVNIVRSNGELYQIILHDKEAYVKWEFDNLASLKKEVNFLAGDRLIDFSSGWMHDLIIVDKQSPNLNLSTNHAKTR